MLSKGSPLSEWLVWLETLSPNEIDLGLERVETVLRRLLLPMPAHLLLIAGTNGKGSSVAMASALLLASGKRVGAYTSPHLHRYNERINVNGVLASDADIVAAFARIEAVREELPLTYFEYGTLAAVVVFAAAELDVWILEVGLGGRLDACNAFTPTASLITNISLDHCDWLGDDLESIAWEKAGVMRAATATVFGSASTPAAIRKYADEIGARLVRAGQDFEGKRSEDGTWDWLGPGRTISALQAPGLPGDVQIDNAAAVLSLLDEAGLLDGHDEISINKILPQLSLDGRSQRLWVGKNEWLLDVAHNPAAAVALARILRAERISGDVIAIVGVLRDKDVDGVISPLVDAVDRWIAVTAESPRAMPAGELGRRIANLTGHSCLLAGSADDAIELARRYALENDKILVSGSFFTVAPVLELLVVDS